MIRLTKEFKFEMAHALYGYDGLCANLHGHSYKLLVTVRGGVKNEEEPKQGMVIDFSVLKSIVKSLIISKYDHSLVLNANHIIILTYLCLRECILCLISQLLKI